MSLLFDSNVFIYHLNGALGHYGQSLLKQGLVEEHRYLHKTYCRHSGMDCRNPEHTDVFEITVHGAGYPLPGGYDGICV